jgi:alpha,alpha-trehalase
MPQNPDQPQRYQAIILDLDGVITQTAQLHARAWNNLFDHYLQRYVKQRSRTYVPFDPASDYRQYVDGKPRYDGIRSFLAARSIVLPEGCPNDPPTAETVCGLGNRKNQLFLELLQQEGITPYADAIEQIQHWRGQGIKTAIVSSSKNCAAVLAAAQLGNLFDVKVDGVDAETLGLPGKPAPDLFLYAAQQLDVKPQQAIVIEDAIVGVEAAREGGFGLVVGIVRNGDDAALSAHGADRVVRDLRELEDLNHAMARPTYQPPNSALESFPAIEQQLRDRHLVLFTDYDGTLTPIVARPELAVLPENMRSQLQVLANYTTVAIISGRDLADVQKMVGLPGLYYAGSHGFDIAGPNNIGMQHEEARQFSSDLDAVERQLHNQLDSITGIYVERKRFAIAVHYRAVAAAVVDTVQAITDAILAQYGSLRQRSGKKIIEIQPDIPWDKGRAIVWLLDRLGLNQPQILPLYLGDDTTDEDAFRALKHRGISIYVGTPDQPTQADYYLCDPDAAQQFFQRLLHHLKLHHPTSQLPKP